MVVLNGKSKLTWHTKNPPLHRRRRCRRHCRFGVMKLGAPLSSLSFRFVIIVSLFQYEAHNMLAKEGPSMSFRPYLFDVKGA